jgi:putative endonuclease
MSRLIKGGTGGVREPATFQFVVMPGLDPGIHSVSLSGREGIYLPPGVKKGGTLYCGVTSDLPRRIWEHREGLTGGFTARYAVKRLVWYEEFDWIIDAIAREKAIKSWPRKWKIALIEKDNPDWRDLSSHLVMF